jgi:thiol-disulfide isomerase/thioredoxin
MDIIRSKEEGLRCVARLLFSPLIFAPLFAQAREAPADILRSALKAAEKIDSIEYEVRRDSKGPDGKLHRSRSTVLAARSPFRFQARFEDEDTGARDMSVLNGDITLYSADGIAGEILRTFVAGGQVVPNRSAADVAFTWRPFFDRDYLSTAIDSGNIVYAGKDDIEGELCHTVLYVRVGEDSGSTTDWYWISAKTGLLRAVQRANLRRGATRLTDRSIISILRINPRFPPSVFSYVPTPADSTPEPPAPRTGATRSLQGTRLPDLEVKDASYASLKLSDMAGEPLLILFWAPWYGGCFDEMRALAKLEFAYRGSLRVVAIAVQDSRWNVLSWIMDHPQFNFTFVTDPELPEAASRLVAYFGANAIPLNVLVGKDGVIIEKWGGFGSAAELEKKLSPYLQTPRK